MTAVVGIDLSLTATGLAAVTDDAMYECTTVESKGKRADTLIQRAMRIERIVDRVNEFACKWRADLIVIEGPSIMSRGGSNWDRAWLWGSVVEIMLSSGVAVVPPTVLKKWATGKGNADKAAVAVAMARMWDQFECESDNQADAIGLASMGSQWLGMDIVRTRAHHAACLAKAEWPPRDLVSPEDKAAIAEEVAQERAADAASGEGDGT